MVFTVQGAAMVTLACIDTSPSLAMLSACAVELMLHICAHGGFLCDACIRPLCYRAMALFQLRVIVLHTLFRRNVLMKKRNKRDTLMETCFPLLFFFLLVTMRGTFPRDEKSGESFEAQPLYVGYGALLYTPGPEKNAEV